MLVAQYLQNVTKKLDLGAELLYQRGMQVPGNQIGIYTLAGRYTGKFFEQISDVPQGSRTLVV